MSEFPGMSFVTELVCDQCHGAYSDREPVLLCPRCGGVLDPRYDLDSLRRNVALDRILARRPGIPNSCELSYAMNCCAGAVVAAVVAIAVSS